MSTGYKITDQEALHYLTFQVVRWIDVFTRKKYKDIIIENLDYCQKNKSLEIYGYVIMTNHIHLLVRCNDNKLSDTIRDFKSYTSKKLLEEIDHVNESRRDWMLNIFSFEAKKRKCNSKYQLWTHENHAELIYSNKFIWQKLDYIHNNPVRAGFVFNPEDYIYSSARNYAGLDSLININLVSMPLKTVK